MKILTWLDVERILREKTNNYTVLPKGVQSFHCFYDAIEIGVDPVNNPYPKGIGA
ncbi:MAG: hypothetical protein U9N77_06150 [Thermodesulfobacteriota bacterium]|nr:hypothetical protein [Thermodesulfobacteriota bacterium]